MFRVFLFFLLNFSFTFLSNSEPDCHIVSSLPDCKSKNTIRIMQYNVEWLFLDYYAPMDCPGNGCTWVNESQAASHLDFVAKVIDELSPDIVNLCEVEGCDELHALNNQLSNNYYQTYLLNGTDTSTGQNVGLLTKLSPLINLQRSNEKAEYPVEDSNCGYTGEPGNSSVSKHYFTEFQFGDLEIAIIAAHLLAQPTDPERCAKREAQAYVLQEIIYNYFLQEKEIIVIGDMNDFDNEIPDVNSNKPTSMVLDILKGNKGKYANAYQLFSVAENIPQEKRFSEWWDSDDNCATHQATDFSLIDHMLVSSNLKSKIHKVFIYQNYSEYCGKMNSDHYPLIIDLSLN